MFGGLVTFFFIIHWEAGTRGAAWAEWLTSVATVPDETVKLWAPRETRAEVGRGLVLNGRGIMLQQELSV